MHDGPIFKIDRPKTDWFIRSTSTVCRREWNALPSHIRLIDDLKEFKGAVKRFYKNNTQEGERERGLGGGTITGEA